MRSHARTPLLLAALLLALLSAPAHGQAPAQERRSARAPQAAPAARAPEAAASLTQARARKVYLPAVQRSAEVQILLGSSADANFVVTSPATVFPVGTTRLYIDARFLGAQGQRYRTDTITPSGRSFVGSDSTAFDPVETDRYYICKTSAFQCGSAETALDAGTYTVRAYLNDVLVKEVTAVIR
jgi:hypothetical protein